MRRRRRTRAEMTAPASDFIAHVPSQLVTCRRQQTRAEMAAADSSFVTHRTVPVSPLPATRQPRRNLAQVTISALLLNKVGVEFEKAKGFTEAKNKRAALRPLKRRKLYEQEIEKLGSFQMRLRN